MDLHTTLVTVIAFAAVISVLSFSFTLLLKPVNKDIQNLKEGQSRIETELENMRKDIYEIKTAFVSSSTTKIIKANDRESF